MTAQVETLAQLAFTVSDVDAALEFYERILGLRVLFRPAPTLAFLDGGGVRIMLSTPQGAGAVGANSIPYFRVRDIAAAHADFVARGARSERAPQLAARMSDHELWIGFLRDPDGNLVGLMEEKR
jgi:catechol 2,3-dioxygenase-like lactoylglutathione lyase family enzyme